MWHRPSSGAVTLVDDHDATLTHGLDRLARRAKFAELFAESGGGQSVVVDTKSAAVQPRPRLAGAVYRVWTGRRWAEAATSDLSERAIGEAVEQLERVLEPQAGSSPPPGESATTKGHWVTRPKRSLRDLGLEGTITLAKDLRGWMTAVDGITEAQVRLEWESDDRRYQNSAGADCRQTLLRTHVLAIPIAMENGRPEFDFWSHGGLGGLETAPPLEEATLREASEASKALLHAKAPPTGEMDVLLDPSVAGLVAHESFGHGTEADQFVRDRSYLKPLVGQTVAPEFVSIVDDGAFAGGWGTIYCDDEGHPAQRTPLVDHGRFVGALHDRETASLLGAKPTGSTRRSDFLSRAFVRMTNTYVATGTHSYSEMLEGVKHGVLLERGTSGIEDPLGGQMQLKVKKGRKIENGKLTDLVSSMALSGRVLDFLKAIRGVERAPVTSISPGFCGKGHTDYLPVGTGGVHLLSHAIVGPA